METKANYQLYVTGNITQNFPFCNICHNHRFLWKTDILGTSMRSSIIKNSMISWKIKYFRYPNRSNKFVIMNFVIIGSTSLSSSAPKKTNVPLEDHWLKNSNRPSAQYATKILRHEKLLNEHKQSGIFKAKTILRS